MKIFLRITSIFSLLSLIFLCGCGTSSEQSLVGQWEIQGPVTSTTEFFDDGTLLVEIDGMEEDELGSISGTWNMPSPNVIEVEMTVMGVTNSSRGTIDFEGEDLIIEMENGQSSRYSPAD